MLTKRQLEIFEFIDAEITRTGGTSPSFEEIRRHLCLKSKSSVFRLLGAVEARGFIRRERRSNRAITILRRPRDKHAAADVKFATIPEDPVDIEAEIDVLHGLIAARLTVLDNVTDAGTMVGADAELDFSNRGRSPCGDGCEEAIV